LEKKCKKTHIHKNRKILKKPKNNNNESYKRKKLSAVDINFNY